MSVSKTCGPFRNHIYMFHVLRGDILKLQEVRSTVVHLSRHSHFLKSYLFFSESFLVAIDHVPRSASCNWTSFAYFVVTDCFEILASYFYSINGYHFFIRIFSVLVYYLRSKSKARIEMVNMLKEMLYIEAKDKEFLLANITRITQNNGKYKNALHF